VVLLKKEAQGNVPETVTDRAEPRELSGSWLRQLPHRQNGHSVAVKWADHASPHFGPHKASAARIAPIVFPFDILAKYIEKMLPRYIPQK
jgi:hypothetical protein